MNKRNDFNRTRRRILKAVAGVTATGMATASSGFAGEQSSFIPSEPAGEIIDCQLLYRDDGSRTYLLMHNKTDFDIVTNRFASQIIRYEDITINMAEALTKPVTVKSQDRILVRLSHQPGRTTLGSKDIIELGTKTKYPTVGTRVVDVPVRIYLGVGIIDDPRADKPRRSFA